jgi:CHAT domain-containing protein
VSTRSIVAVLAGIGSSVPAFLTPASAFAQSAQRAPIPLAVDQHASATQRAGELVTYTFDARAGRTYLIEVDQQGLDFKVTIDGGGVSRSYNSPLRRDEPELVVVAPAQDEPYRVTIASDEPTDASGTHEIRLELFDDGRTRDTRAIAALQLMSDAATASPAVERAEEARRLYLAAATFWQQLGQTRRQAQALYSAGMLEYWHLENWDAAIENADKAAELYLALHDTRLYADTLLLRGYSEIETAGGLTSAARAAAFERALATLGLVLRLDEDLGYDFGKAHVLNFIGVTHYNRGDPALNDFDVARDYYNRSADLFSSLGEWREESNALQNIVVVDQTEGKSLQAIASYERILDRLPPARLPDLRATILGNLGIAHAAFGNIDEALRAHSDAYALSESINDRTGQGYALRNLGDTYFAIGDLGSAKRYLEQAQVLAESTNDFRTQAAVQSSLGNVAFAESEFAIALERHRKAVELTASSEGRARRELFVATDLTALSRHAEAIETAQAAHGESRAVLTQADALLRVARAAIALGEIPRAKEALGEALGVYETLQLTARQGDALNALALAARAEGDLAAARDYGGRALDKIESLRERVANPELRALNAASRRRYYEDQIDVLMALHERSGEQQSEYLAEALTVSERSRARLTMDLLGEAAVQLNRGMDSDLVAKRRALYDALAEKRQQQERESSSEGAARLSSQMDEIENQLALLETEYRRAHPTLGRFGSAATLTAAEIQAGIDPDAILLQYSLGEARSFLWAVTRESIRGFVLPDRVTIERAAREVHADLGLAPGARVGNSLQAKLARLAQYVLHDVGDIVATKRRLLVAADGALQYVPFGVLPVAGPAHTRPIPLIAARDDLEIVAVASMSARRAVTSPSRSGPASIALFADPVMEEADGRFEGDGSTAPAPTTDALMTARSATGPTLGRLPYTGREAQAIAALLPNAANHIAVGFDANLDAVLSDDLRKYRYVHFATHGIVDSERPSLSALALSQFDERRQRRPGYLRLYDIYTLALDADVVVLSACETALGREIRGEGFIGLTQGFAYAGARNVVASVWQVPDSATAELMTRFYQRLLTEHQSPASALADAQRSMAVERGRADPYFWGAFVIQGQ